MTSTATTAMISRTHAYPSTSELDMSVSDLSLHLSRTPVPATQTPEERGIARDEVKLLVLHKETGRTEHACFHQLSEFLNPGDVLVVNTSKTLPASLPAVLGETGSQLRVHLASRLTQTTYVIERRTEAGEASNHPFEIGEKLVIGDVPCIVIGRYHPNSRLWYVESKRDLWQVALQSGRPIRYGYLDTEPQLDAFQTVFARDIGSAEMPSAARPFSGSVVNNLKEKGVEIAEITLHTGVSSHEVSHSLADHPFLPEWYSVPANTATLVNRANREGRRVIAVGTTVVRALAAVTEKSDGCVHHGSGWTTVVVTPKHPVPSVTGLITGLHEDATSHLAMLFSFVDSGKLRATYEEAVQRGYLWHEFGDSNLIL